MNTEREKLIEIWLDNATEREYQFAFRSVLIFSGYKILHDTSHTSLELGKDIIARAPDGSINAYQLKGNPGGRITISQWQELIPQINSLIYQPINHPNIPASALHQPILVTNGEIHEDVSAAIVALNQRVAAAVPVVRQLSTMARGELLSLFVAHADKIWPVSVEMQRDILNLLASDGGDAAPSRHFGGLIVKLLGIGESKKQRMKIERIAAAHLITSIIASNWQKEGNLFEVVRLYALLYGSVCAYVDWSNGSLKVARPLLAEIEFNIWQTLGSFAQWLRLRHPIKGRPLINSNILTEFAYFHPRQKMVIGLVSVLALASDVNKEPELADYIWSLVCETSSSQYLFGEAILPFCLAAFWAQSSLQGKRTPDVEIVGILRTILSANSDDNARRHIVGPYYTLPEVIEWQLKEFLGVGISKLDEDDHYQRSWFAESIFYLVARRNYKQACKYFWFDLTKFLHSRTRLQAPWQFGLIEYENASHEDKQVRVPQTWADVVDAASREYTPLAPAVMMERPLMVLLYCLFVPHRMDFDTVLWLDRKLSLSTWY